MVNGYLLRDVINMVDGIHFTSSDEIHTLGALYESMLREMRDAAGDSGEFYTPRPVVRFMVRPSIRAGRNRSSTPPAAPGFLVETYEHLKPQAATVEDLETLQRSRRCKAEGARRLPAHRCQPGADIRGIALARQDKRDAALPGVQRSRAVRRHPNRADA